MKKIIILPLIYLFLYSSHCTAQSNPSFGGNAITKEITLPSFETVEIKGGGKFYFHYSPHFNKMQLKGDNSCIMQTEHSVSSNKLTIWPNSELLEACNFEIHIFTSTLTEIQQDGGGIIVINDGFAPVSQFACRINGGGIIEMTALKVDALYASIKGGGKVSAQVTKTIQAKINGGGIISYLGEPAIASDISGGGIIKRIKD